MSKKKFGVKKGSDQANSYLDKSRRIVEAKRLVIFEDGMQYALDIASVVMNQEFGFGQDRLRRFSEAFDKLFQEIQAESRSDRDDKDRWYSEQKFEDAMMKAWGKFYEPRSVRYREDIR